MGKQYIGYCLTDEGKRIAAENVKLASLMAKKYCPPYGMGFDEWMSECYECLCQAVARYDETKGTLSSLMDRLVWLRRSNLNSSSRTIHSGWGTTIQSLDAERGEDGFNLHDVAQTTDEQARQSIEDRELAELALAECSERGREVLGLLMDGLSLPDIGEALGGFSRQYACQKVALERAKVVAKYPHHVISNGPCRECGKPTVRPCKKHTAIYLCPECAAARVKKSANKFRQKKRKGKVSQ